MISVLNRAAGFFSQFFFTMNHYIHCKKYKFNFALDSTDWTFGYNQGWQDYFEPIDFKIREQENERRIGHGTITEDVTFQEYRNVIPEMFRYNEDIQLHIKQKQEELDLQPNTYASIFIRRGDKLLCESKYIPTTDYLEVLLKAQPQTQTIFLQTDDYNTYLDIQSYLTTNNQSIKVITLCPPTLFGFTMSDREFYNTQSNFQENQPYIDQIKEKQIQNKLIFDLTKEEMREHMYTFLLGIELVHQSQICVTDYSSNVARFLKLWETKENQVIDVLGTEYDLTRRVPHIDSTTAAPVFKAPSIHC